MAKYQDAQGNITEVGNPDLNPDLIAGKTLVPDAPATNPQNPVGGTDPATGLPLVNPNQPAPAPTPATPATPAPTPGTPAPQPLASAPVGSPAPAPTPAPVQTQSEYIVKPGDTLNAIAQRLGVSPSSITGYRSNNPNKIDVGEKLTVHANPATPSTVVKAPLPQSTTAQTGQTTPTDTSTGKTPFQNVMDTYTEVYQSLGLGNLKSRYTDALKQIDDIQSEMNDKVSEVNNNPWLSATSRNEQIDKIKEKYTPRLDTATHLATLIDSLAKEGEQTAQFLVGHVETDTQKAIDLAQKKQDALDKLAEQDIHPDTVNGRAVLVDYKTRKIVADLGPTGTGSGSGDVLSVSDATLLGVPYGTTKTQAISMGKTPEKPLTVDQAKATGFATRASTANDIIGNLQNKITGFNSLAYATQSKFESSDITNSLASDEIKQSRQAERNFATAVLRQESGAAISQGEFDTLAKQYFPRPGDDATTLAQKTQARADAIASLGTSAGPSYKASQSTPTQSSVWYDSNSKTTYVLNPADNKYYPQ